MEYYNEQATLRIGISFRDDYPESNFQLLPTFASGFYAQRVGDSQAYLITNWHVTTGKDPHSKRINTKCGLTPRELLIQEWPTNKIIRVPLHDSDDKPRWIEIDDEVPFEKGTSIIDVVAIPIKTNIHPVLFGGMQSALHYSQIQPTDQVSVLGYPYARYKCIWKTCHVAESITDHRTYFLINGRTKSGMSGAGVFSTAERNLQGNVLIGIYSGRIQDKDIHETLNDLDLGVVWKLSALERLIPKMNS